MENDLPNIKVFRYVEEADLFVETLEYKDIATKLGLGEWNRVVWIGRLFSLDNNFGEHWFDNWELIDEKEDVIKSLNLTQEDVFVIDPKRFENGQDGPCNNQDFRKKFWTNVLKNLHLNLGLLIEKGYQINDKNQSSMLIKNENLLPYEKRVEEVLQIYSPQSEYIRSSTLNKLGVTMLQIKEIVEELDTGMLIYIDKATKEIISFPEAYEEGIVDPDPWGKLQQQVEANPKNYWGLRKMSSRESYLVMERFADQVASKHLKSELLHVLNLRNPFRNFRNVIDDSGKYREQWFAFREKELQNYVLTQIKTIFSLEK